jgi:C-terminal processing protease CtpA/Prc
MKYVYTLAAATSLALSAGSVFSQQQSAALSPYARKLVSDMLHDAYAEVKAHYYDPKFQGVDLDARYQQFAAKIDGLHDAGGGIALTASFLDGLKDSHTYLIPPGKPGDFDLGYRMGLVGDNCFVTHIRPQSDAESKLHIGDQILTVNGFKVDRNDFHAVQYFFGQLAPRKVQKLDVKSPAGDLRTVEVAAAVRQDKRVTNLANPNESFLEDIRNEKAQMMRRDKIVEMGDVTIWKIRQFSPGTTSVEKAIATARKHSTLIIDLRGNGGGAVVTLQALVGSLFDHEIRVADRVGRSNSKPTIAYPQGRRFDGKVIVLVDGSSASASEILARVIQLEKRGIVVGDRSSGAVMEAMRYDEAEGMGAQMYYGFSVTDANLIMKDGKSLEKIGVLPDEVMLPTAADLAAGQDPVLARAAELAGLKLDSAEAGKMFPYEWMPM